MKKTTHQGLFYGLSTFDIQFLTNTYPKENTKTRTPDYGVYAGGPATNAAITFAFLGGQTSLVSALGQHPLAEVMRTDLIGCNVHHTDLTPHSHLPPTFASIVTSKDNGSRTILTYSPPADKFDLPDTNVAPETSIALFDGFFCPSAIAVAKAARQQGVITVLDGGSWKDGLHELLPHIDYAICSNDFAPPHLDKTDKMAIVTYLAHQMPHKNIAISRGHDTVLVWHKGEHLCIQPPTVQATDTLGAGDIFHGAFCYYMLLKNDFTKALQQAAKIAAFSCRSFGTRQWMTEYNIDLQRP